MQINSIGAMNSIRSTSFGKKEQCQSGCKSQDSSMICVPRPVYNKMLGLAMLAMVAGGPLSSCKVDPIEPPTPPVVITQDPVLKMETNIFQILGLISMTSLKSASLQKGELLEFGFTDGGDGVKYDFKINAAESDKDKRVYYGTGDNFVSGGKSILRRTVSSTDNSLMVKLEAKADDSYYSLGTREFVPNSNNTVDEYNFMSDGTKSKIFTWSPNSLTSLIKTQVGSGKQFLVDNILIVLKD